MKKTLLITGKRAEKTVKKEANKLNNYFEEKEIFEVKTLPIDVASFITKEMVDSIDLKNYDQIIVPGNARGNYGDLGKVYKGTRNVVDLFDYLKKGEEKLSPKKPLDDVIDLDKKYEEEYREFEENSPDQLKIKDLEIGKQKPMRIAAEIVDVHNKTETELKNTIKRYSREGADILDLGLNVSPKEEKVKEAIEIARETTDKPISIDTTDSKAIKTSIKKGIDLILSITWENFEELKDELNNQICVVASRNRLAELIKKVKNTGAKPIADPILDPPNMGLMKSLNRYYQFKKKDKKTPIFLGAGNVTEMMDADSVGINAVIASIASELDASIIFTTEASNKTKNSIKELKKSIRLVYLAKKKNTTPKDLGINLLELKDKKDILNTSILAEKVIKAEKETGYSSDIGYFEISIDRSQGNIVATYFKEKDEPKISIKGKEANEITDTLEKKGLVNKIEHAFYLGRELKKAEIALKTGKNYQQEVNLF